MAGTTTFYGISYPTSTDYVKDGASAIQTVATGFDSAVAIPTYNAQTGATYTFVLADTGKTVTASNASAQTYTIPPTASVAWTANTTLRVLNLGAGVVTFAAGAGVTVTNTAQTLTQYQSAKLVRTGLNAWTVAPDSGTASTSGLTLLNTTTFSAVASASVNDVFSATYENYRILTNITSQSVDGSYYLKMRVSSVDSSASYYLMNGGFTSTNGGYNTNANNQTTGFNLGDIDAATNDTYGFNGDIMNPFLSVPTRLLGLNNAMTTGGTPALQFGGGVHVVSTSYTGFTLLAGSGNITGNVKVYGYAK
jgi:hypothetical protein